MLCRASFVFVVLSCVSFAAAAEPSPQAKSTGVDLGEREPDARVQAECDRREVRWVVQRGERSVTRPLLRSNFPGGRGAADLESSRR